MKSRAFTLLELLLVVAAALLILGLGVPVYRQYARGRTVRLAAEFLQSALSERKHRAVALGSAAGLCVGNDAIRSYEVHPFLSTVNFKVLKTLDSFSPPVSVSVAPSAPPPLPPPCSNGEASLWVTPNPDFTQDWKGTVTVTSATANWRLTFSGNGEVSGGP